MSLNWVQYFLAPSGFPFSSRNTSRRQPVGIFTTHTQPFLWHLLRFQMDLGMTSDARLVIVGSSSYLPVNNPLGTCASLWVSSMIRLRDLFVSLHSKICSIQTGLGVGAQRVLRADGMDPAPLFTGNWEVNARFPLLDTHFSFQFLALGQTVKASSPLSGHSEQSISPLHCIPSFSLPRRVPNSTSMQRLVEPLG